MNYFTLVVVFAIVSTAYSQINQEDIHEVLSYLKKKCHEKYEQLEKKIEGCGTSFDDFFGCWPPAERNTTSHLQCNDVMFHNTDNVDRYCSLDGKWDSVSYVQQCKFLPVQQMHQNRIDFLLKYKLASLEEIKAVERQAEFQKIHTLLLHITRYLDLTVCAISAGLIMWLIPLKNNRFTLHLFLIFVIMVQDVLQILLLKNYSNYYCSVIGFFTDYTLMVSVFMMSCEGFYQFRQFYFVFVTKQRIWAYILFAYGTPAIIVFGIYIPLVIANPPVENFSACYIFISPRKYFYVIYGPIIFLLLLNLAITFYLMRLILSKLKTEKTTELFKIKKAARGLLILSFLLGIIYGLTLYGTGWYDWWHFTRIVLIPLQGVLICISQVFISNHIRKALKRKISVFFTKIQVANQRKESKSTFSSVPYPGYHDDKRTSTTSTLSIISRFRSVRKNQKHTSNDFQYVSHHRSSSLAGSDVSNKSKMIGVEFQVELVNNNDQSEYLNVIRDGDKCQKGKNINTGRAGVVTDENADEKNGNGDLDEGYVNAALEMSDENCINVEFVNVDHVAVDKFEDEKCKEKVTEIPPIVVTKPEY